MSPVWDGPDRRAPHRQQEELIADAVRQACDQVADRVVQETVPVAIERTFQKFGIDTTDPVAVQGDMAYLREAAQRARDPEVLADRAFTRETRHRCEKFWSQFYSAILQTAVKFILLAFLAGTAATIGLNLDSIIGLVR
jgi:hypothetical protein